MEMANLEYQDGSQSSVYLGSYEQFLRETVATKPYNNFFIWERGSLKKIQKNNKAKNTGPKVTWSAKMAAMTSKFNVGCMIQ